uniref:Uncharacterized protein n=1 Tax=Tetraselmis sp. GSL018 TaxID=582737 RepID=A0A061RCS5_9CHLO
MDCLSLVTLLCPDFPLNVVRAAFKPAAFISKGVSQLENPELAVPPPTFLSCLAVTFLLERFLVEMRHEAFDSKSKQFVPAQRVKESADSVRELVESAGWPTPPGDIMRSIVEAAADAKRCISFDILVRSMCESEALCSWVSDEVRTLDASARHAAAASRAALEFRARVDADILAGNDSASMVPPRSPDRAKGRRGKGQR